MSSDAPELFDPESEPSRESDLDDWADYAAEAPDELDGVIEVADMMAVFAAQRLVRIDAMRRSALEDAERHGLVLTEVIERSIRLELAAALRITEHAAGELITLSDALVRRYPTVLQSLGRAAITEHHASILASAIDALEPELREAVLPRALALAEAESVGVFRRSLRRLVDTVRSVTLTERHEAALESRRAVLEQGEDAMAWLHLYGPAVEMHAAYARATAIAKVLKAREDETRSLDQLRVDVLCDLLIEGDTMSHPDEARGIRATVAVTAPVMALLGTETVTVKAPAPASRQSSKASGRSRSSGHANSAAVTTGGCGSSRTPRREWSCRSGGTDTDHRPACESSCSGEPTAAWLPDAVFRPPDARSTTTWPGSPEGTPAWAICARSARAITS